MQGSRESLKKKIGISFSIIIILILCSFVLGWVITEKIEENDGAIATIHQFKEQELQLRRIEKNLLIRGYSQDRVAQWQMTNENFHRTFGHLIGLKALDTTEVDELRILNSQTSEVYKDFFERLRTAALETNQLAHYDETFKAMGRRSLEIIDAVLAKQENVAKAMDSRSQTLIVVFALVFIGTTSFLVVNVLKNL